jgi:hypothetical protein
MGLRSDDKRKGAVFSGLDDPHPLRNEIKHSGIEKGRRKGGLLSLT